MSRLSKERLDRIYAAVAKRDGEFCHVGGEPGNPESLFLAQWKGGAESHDPTDIRLVCQPVLILLNRSCRLSRKKNDPSDIIYVCESIEAHATVSSRTSLELLKSLVARPLFNHWLF